MSQNHAVFFKIDYILQHAQRAAKIFSFLGHIFFQSPRDHQFCEIRHFSMWFLISLKETLFFKLYSYCPKWDTLFSILLVFCKMRHIFFKSTFILKNETLFFQFYTYFAKCDTFFQFDLWFCEMRHIFSILLAFPISYQLFGKIQVQCKLPKQLIDR